MCAGGGRRAAEAVIADGLITAAAAAAVTAAAHTAVAAPWCGAVTVTASRLAATSAGSAYSCPVGVPVECSIAPPISRTCTALLVPVRWGMGCGWMGSDAVRPHLF